MADAFKTLIELPLFWYVVGLVQCLQTQRVIREWRIARG